MIITRYKYATKCGHSECGSMENAVNDVNRIGEIETVEYEVPEPIPLTVQQIKVQQIQSIESTITPRRIREATLGIDGGWLLDINNQIETIRNQ
jgi:hypothetical protein